MGLLSVLGRAALVTAVLLIVATATVLDREDCRRAHRNAKRRLRVVSPHLAVLLIILGFNEVARTLGPELSWLIGWNVTSLIYTIEGTAVGHIQSIASVPLTEYFSFMYLYGYIFLLLFPFVVYFAAEDPGPLKKTAIAYTLNYGIGVIAYILFIAYGPRNLMPDTVESLLYTTHPQAQLLTRQVNVNTNVFPSLHSSLSVTVAALAWQTRDRYPRWTAIASWIGLSVVIATMYLGIHWVIDVIGGIGLALVSVYLAGRWVSRRQASEEYARGVIAD